MYCLVMKYSSVRLEWATFEIPTWGPLVILMVLLKEHLNIDSQWKFVCSLIGPFMLEQYLASGNYPNFLMNV
jgi:hypothetical protein